MNIWNRHRSSEEILKRIGEKNRLQRGFTLILGLILIAISFNLFLLPSEIVYGGVSGLSIIIRRLFGTDPATFIFWSSMFLLACSAILLGKKKTLNSVLGSILFPVFVKLTENIGSYITLQQNDLLLMAVFGSLINGLGAGLIFKGGFTTGGTDILNQIVHKYLKVSIGQAMLMTDGLIVLGSGLVLGPEIVMYGIIALYIISIMTDKVILGISSSKAFYIITSKEEEVQAFILENLSRGITVLDAHGGYSGKQVKVLMCIIPTKDYFKLKEGIAEIDEEAFFVVTDAYEVHTAA